MNRLFWALLLFAVVVPQGSGCTRAHSRAQFVCPTSPPSSINEAMRLIHRIKPWTSIEAPDDYTSEDWGFLLDVAQLFQVTDENLFQSALDCYVQWASLDFSPEHDFVSEWTKPFLLLRVVFDVHGDLPVNDASSCQQGLGGFSSIRWSPVETGTAADASTSASLPIEWKDGSPRIAVKSAGYNGGKYLVLEEYDCFKSTFGFRKHLKESRLRVSGPTLGG